MSKTEIGRWSDQLRRMFGMAGVTAVARELSPEISPVVVLEQPTPDLAFLKGVRQCFVANRLTAAVGFTAKWRLRNPAGSGVIAVLEAFELSAVGISTFRAALNQQTVNLATVIATTIPDLRWEALNVASSRATMVASMANNGGGPAGDIFFESDELSQTPARFAQPFPMLPGTTLDFSTVNTNVACNAWATWTERSFPEMER